MDFDTMGSKTEPNFQFAAVLTPSLNLFNGRHGTATRVVIAVPLHAYRSVSRT
jgi:hypothetical protein